jgi:hypothetical protein
MNAPCTAPLALDELLAYHRGELEASHEEAVEAHYFGCEFCSERLAWLEQLGSGVAGALRRGLLDVAITRESVDRLERTGAVVRKYEVQAGQSVNCTIAPGEDMTVATLRAPLRPNVPVTLLLDVLDRASGRQMQELHPAFQDQRTGEIIFSLGGEDLRAVGDVRFTISVRYGEGPDAETAGPFVMNHSRWK